MKFHIDNCIVVHRGKCTQNTYMPTVFKSLGFSEESDVGITEGSSRKMPAKSAAVVEKDHRITSRRQ